MKKGTEVIFIANVIADDNTILAENVKFEGIIVNISEKKTAAIVATGYGLYKVPIRKLIEVNEHAKGKNEE